MFGWIKKTIDFFKKKVEPTSSPKTELKPPKKESKQTLTTPTPSSDAWLHNYKGKVKTPYTNRHLKFLQAQGRDAKSIAELDRSTDEVLELLACPKGRGERIKRGLVIGSVQSGKTSHYLALINKSVDYGYKLIILISGVHENLRKQTQERVDKGFIGFDITNLQEVGVAKYGKARRPISLSSSQGDLRSSSCQNFLFNPAESKAPVIIVVKKNALTLKSLMFWLNAHRQEGKKLAYPMLLIDDEADNASINTHKEPRSFSVINGAIREILDMFKVRSYVAYTATPFANILIDPDSISLYGKDLFPDSFLIVLEPPKGYMGIDKVFGKNNIKNNIVAIEDIVYENGYLNEKVRKGDKIVGLPSSLIEAIDYYLLSMTLKKIRIPSDPFTSMLINTSTIVEVQKRIKELVLLHLNSVVKLFSEKNLSENFIKDPYIKRLKILWDKIGEKEVLFEDVLDRLAYELNNLEVFLINSASKEKLNYEQFSQRGINAIAIGGYSLSRGFTLEGLVVSYFLRNTKMYDTLLQMGRWFGYRNNYEDLCRIYMKPEIIEEYRSLDVVLQELKEDVQSIRENGNTPREQGLKIKTIPNLSVTARNKMHHSAKANFINRYDRGVLETRKMSAKPKDIQNNLKALKDFISEIEGYARDMSDEQNYLWRDIPTSKIMKFISSYKVSTHNVRTQDIQAYISQEKFEYFDVAIMANKRDYYGVEKLSTTLNVNKKMRSASIDNEIITLSGGTIRCRGREDIVGLDRSKLPCKKDLLKNGMLEYRKLRNKPLLAIYVLNLKIEDKEADFPHSIVAYGIDFPLKSEDYTKESYIVNKPWLEENGYL